MVICLIPLKGRACKVYCWYNYCSCCSFLIKWIRILALVTCWWCTSSCCHFVIVLYCVSLPDHSLNSSWCNTVENRISCPSIGCLYLYIYIRIPKFLLTSTFDMCHKNGLSSRISQMHAWFFNWHSEDRWSQLNCITVIYASTLNCSLTNCAMLLLDFDCWDD
jgi:hypothetical protein